MLFITGVPFCRTLDPAGKDEFPCFVQPIEVFKSLTTTHGRWTVEPAIGVISFEGRALNRRRENITSWTVCWWSLNTLRLTDVCSSCHFLSLWPIGPCLPGGPFGPGFPGGPGFPRVPTLPRKATPVTFWSWAAECVILSKELVLQQTKFFFDKHL